MPSILLDIFLILLPLESIAFGNRNWIQKNILNTKLWNITGRKTKGGRKENLLRDRKGPKSSYLIIYLGREGYLLSATCEANIENTILAITFDGQLKLNFVWNIHVIFFSYTNIPLLSSKVKQNITSWSKYTRREKQFCKNEFRIYSFHIFIASVVVAVRCYWFSASSI